MSLISGQVDVYFVDDNKETLVSQQKNMIAVGLGYSIANLMTDNQDEKIDNYIVRYGIFGTGSYDFTGISSAASGYIFNLVKPVNLRFLNLNLSYEIKNLNSLTGTTFVTSDGISLSEFKQSYISLPDSKISAISNNAVRHTLVLDDSVNQNYIVKEIGLFIKNPDLYYPEDVPILAAYKAFTTDIIKPSGVKLKIDWTFRFNI
jgi:hypothetical protein